MTVRQVTILPMEDQPGFAYEVNWIDEDGETTSIDARDLDDVIDTIRTLLGADGLTQTE